MGTPSTFLKITALRYTPLLSKLTWCGWRSSRRSLCRSRL